MDINDLFGPGGHTVRPDHPDFWSLSEILLGMDGSMQEATSEDEKTRIWHETVESVGDEDSIQYMVMQRVLRICGVRTALDYFEVVSDPQRSTLFTQTLQAYFDAFILGAKFGAKKEAQRG